DRDLDIDMSPKPTMFLPSITEIKHDNTGTYLCLLENFFPHVIKVYWREKRGNRVLPSQQGNTVKTADTYMKFSWLTVSENSMDKEHICIVKHEKNKRGDNQEILFPPSSVSGGLNDVLHLHLMNTSAYYTYLLLLITSTVYLVIITSCVFRRTGVCGIQKSS
uniref:Ig-like domain-containing protein n=1 Tax=Bos indicus x Bos taurus TaxID=30522 RepID=A0A4W2CVK5_BOBOX